MNDSKKVLQVLSLITKMLKIDQKLYQLHIAGSSEMRSLFDKNGSWFINYQMTVDAIWVELYGETEAIGYHQFRTTGYDNKDLPIAWYKGEYNTKGDGSIKGPEGHTGYIPDEINMVILSNKMIPSKKFQLLHIMFDDLKRLKKNYERRKNKLKKAKDQPIQEKNL